MNKKVLMSTIVLLALFMMTISQIGAGAIRVCFPPPARAIDPIVSTKWLEDNLDTPNLVILDVRSPEAYGLGHIEGSINVPSYMWYINPPFGPDLPWMELPAKDDLFNTIGSAGITKDSLVVVVGSTSGPLYPVPYALYGIADASRVAITLLYAGVRNVAILDGGYDKWVNEGKPVSTVPFMPTPVPYTGKVDKTMFVSKDYVAKRIGKSIIVDARDPDVYFGVTIEPWPPTPTAGHIPKAKSLPTPWLWNLNLDASGTVVIYATYKDVDTLREMASGVVGRHVHGWHKFKEIIVYCGVGGYASTSYFVLSEVLGYKNVKMYDGSWQEWSSDPEAPVVLYRWE